ncbi:MAG TPA: hypothetical protein VJV03_17530 [Pyrinomonadaceae bacterium]|nr:hypothetical protein [Pyrinomonadaceae bacterium]
MKLIKSLMLLVAVQILVCAQQTPPKSTAPTSRCHGCPRRVAKKVVRPPQAPASPPLVEFFVGEARVNVTKDETVVRLAMAQHGSVLIELPANDGPRYIIPGDPEMATVDENALERNKRAIVVRPGTQFVPPLRNLKARTPSATVTAQMRSGLVVTFLFYPVEDLAQNVHRCVLSYNRDEVVARRRAAGLPVNLDNNSQERRDETGQSTAPPSTSVENAKEEEKQTSARTPIDSSTSGPESNLPPETAGSSSKGLPKQSTDTPSYAASARTALQEAMKQPKRFKNWTKPAHGLSLSLRPTVNAERFNVVLLAVKNKSSDTVKLTPDIPDLSIEMLDDRSKPLNIESIKKLHTEASDASGLIPKGGIVYYAIAYPSPVLSVHQQVRLSVAQSNAADEPASIVVVRSEK